MQQYIMDLLRKNSVVEISPLVRKHGKKVYRAIRKLEKHGLIVIADGKIYPKRGEKSKPFEA